MTARFEWDESKRLENIHRHGFDFVDAEDVFLGFTLTNEDARFEYGERRFITTGMLKGRVVIVVHTEIAEVFRVISMRKATRHERQTFFENFPD